MRRIQQISVNGLFGTFNHTIHLKREERITVIHGPNGFGKTTLLTMLDELFKSTYRKLFFVPFQEFCVECDDASYVRLRNMDDTPGTKRNEPHTLSVHFWKPDMNEEEDFIINRPSLNDVIRLVEEIPEVRRVGPNTWTDRSSGEILSIDEIIERYNNYLPSNAAKEQNGPDWKDLRESISIRFIQTQRLLSHSKRYGARYDAPGYESPLQPVVAQYAKELAATIESKLAEYAARSQSLDRTFPIRLLEQNTSPELTDDLLREKLNELEKKRERFIAAGLLDRSEDASAIPEQMRRELGTDTRGVLSVYVDDVDRKLSVLDEIANKIDLLRTIVNKRFQYKEMIVSKKKGFTFTSSHGSSLSPADLSSGEQHELVMLYEFLFKVKPGTLILIDEPEISLHVAWQTEFLNDLQEIMKLSDSDVLVATHSPDIISDKWELTVALKGPSTPA